jgi:cytochrome b subunit of formate dehydrogenase
MNRLTLLVVGVILTLVAVVLIVVQKLSGAQPWGPTLSDNMIFAKAIPFTLGFGVAVGTFAALAPSVGKIERRASDGAVRRFRPLTMAMHWIAALGFVLGLVSGSWQYLKGVLDVESPVFMPWVYRTHYIGATLLLFAMSSMLTYWLVSGVRGLLPPKGQRIRHIRGLAHELPQPFRGTLAVLLGLDMRRQSPPTEQFTYYETTVSFPTWLVLLGLVTLTGLLKAMRYIYPIPGDLLYWASALHVTSLVLLAVKLLDHLRYVLAPSRWPLMTSMVSTWIAERYVQLRHPGWYAEIEPGQASAPTPRETPQQRPSSPPAPVAGSTAGSAGGGA